MSKSYESFAYGALVDHFSQVTRAIDQLDGVIGDAYNDVLSNSEIPDVDSTVLDPFVTGPGYIDKDTGHYITQRSGDVGWTNMVLEQDPKPIIDYGLVPKDLHQAYHRLAGTASPEGIAMSRLKEEVIEEAYPEDTSDKIAVRRPLYVFRLASPEDSYDQRISYPGDVVALPEIVNPEITKRIGQQVVVAQHIIGQLVDNPQVAEAAKTFESVHHVLSRSRDKDSKGDPWAPVRTYKEGILTAAQAISFLSEGITDEASFRETLERWKQEKTIETLAFCLPGSILGPLAVRGVQPMGSYIRSASGGMRPELKTSLQKLSAERKQDSVGRGVGMMIGAEIPLEALNTTHRLQISEGLFGDRGMFLPNWGCLASPSVIRRVTNIVSAKV